MFIHAAKSGQKEAERLIHCSHWQGLHKLDSGVDVSTIQLQGYWMSNKEIGDLYHQVYVLKRLPRPQPCRPERAWEITKDTMSSLKDHLRWRKVEQAGGGGELESAGTCPSCHWNQASWRGRQDTSGEQELTKAREALWQALVAATALEECIERLSQSTTRMWLDVCHCSQSQDWPRRRSQGQKHRCSRAPQRKATNLGPLLWVPAGSHWWVTFLDPGMTLEEEQVFQQASADLDLGPLLELGPDLKCFLQGLGIMQGEGRGSNLSQGPLVEGYKDWIEWRGCRVDTPNWWWE